MFLRLSALLIAVLVAVPGGQVLAQQRQVPDSQEQIRLSFAPVVRQVAPAVVNIRARQLAEDAETPLSNDPFYRRFQEEQRYRRGRPNPRGALGSGVIVRPEGIVVTNNHVIRNAEVIEVILADRREFEAEVLLRDERTDLAVLQIKQPGEPEALPYVELGDADDLEVGDVVLAIGNPFGVGQTVTSGIVSALARTSVSLTDYRFFIQTDASINPGNSGGALATLDGKVVGINTAIFSRSGGSIGIGFAIPANMAARVVEAAQRGEPLRRPWMGAVGQTVTADIARSVGLQDVEGVIIQDIAENSPAAEAGLRPGDIILEINARPVVDSEGLRFRLATLPPRGEAVVTVFRGGSRRAITLSLRPAPEEPPRNITRLTGRQPLSGSEVGNMSPGFAEELGLRFTQGVIILRMQRGGVAHRLGFRPGDIIKAVNNRRLSTVGELQTLLSQARGGWEIRFRRGDRDLVRRVRQ